MPEKISYSWIDTNTLYNEKTFVKKFNENNSLKILQKIGQGNFATCFVTNKNTILKTNIISTSVNIDRVFDGQLDWLKYTSIYSNNHTPVIYETFIKNIYYATHMERLTPLPKKYIDHNVTTLLQHLNRLEPINKYYTNISPQIKPNPLYSSLKSCYNSLYETIQYNIKINDTISLDINSSNLCYRNNLHNLIILDPFWKKYAT